jgi:carbonic anhydrase
MRKLIEGIVEFRTKVRDAYRESFGRLATSGQAPDTLFIACSDSRVVPNTFASTNPGDLFVLRNVGNLVPPCDENGISISDESEAAAIEFAVLNLNVRDIVVCGHSECGAMRAICAGRKAVELPHLRSWLRHGEPALHQHEKGGTLDAAIPVHDQVSQLNVLLQIEHIKSYPVVRKRMEEGTLSVHGWWFDLAPADVYAYDQDAHRFVLIDEETAERILLRMHR